MGWTQVKAFNPSKMGTRKGYCLMNCRLGFGISRGTYPSAKADMEAQRRNGTLHAGAIPTNVAVPVYIDSTSKYEHVIVADHGVYYSDGKRLSGIGGLKVFGWGECCDGVRVVKYTADPTPTTGFLPAKGYWGFGDTDARVGQLSSFMRKTFPAYTNVKALGNYFGPYLKAAVTEFQKRTGLQADGNVGPKTYAKLRQYGFNA